LSKHEKGNLFEKLTELVLLTKPTYKTRYKNVWLLRDGIDSKLSTKLNLPNVDEGIDIIAETYNGSYCSIQCKFIGANESPTRKDIATFLNLSRNYAVSLRLKSPYAWKKTMKELTSTNKIPKNIPSRPEVTYKNKGWISWGHWLGIKT
jgi:predicted helicase